jgi:hypothetical protein
MNIALRIACIGAGATLVVDFWELLRHWLLGQPRPDWALVGRWFAHLPRGRFRHAAIGQAPSVRGEAIIGWVAHYLVGMVFAATLIAIEGADWFQRPALLPALLLGIATVAAPFLILQPGMGLGIAGSKARYPTAMRAQSLVTHAVFGVGLYLSALLLVSITGE